MNQPSHRLLGRLSPYGRGFATLTTALILLTATTMITLYGARSTILKQRVLANDVRAQEAFEEAEAAVERGIQFVSKNRRDLRDNWIGDSTAQRWSTCGTATALPCGNGDENVFGSGFIGYQEPGVTNAFVTNASTSGVSEAYLVARCQDDDGDGNCDDLDGATAGTQPGPAPESIITVIGRGFSDDGTGTAMAQQTVALFPLLASPPDSPMVVAGTAGLTGTFDLVANPNGGGPGVPLSVWSNNDVTIGSNARTCHLEEYLATGGPYQEDGITKCDDCDCSKETISDDSLEGIDIVDSDSNSGVNPDATNFPADVFQYVFGVSTANWRDIQEEAVQVLPDCSTLDANSSGLYWVTGDCTIGDDIGSADDPVMLVMDEADLTLNGGGELYGVVFSFDNPDKTGGGGGITVNGTNDVYGAFVSDHSIDISSGTFRSRYDAEVLTNLSRDAGGQAFGKVPGTWFDIYDGQTN